MAMEKTSYCNGKTQIPRKNSRPRAKWDEIFKALVKLSKNVGRERQFLEDRMKYLHEVIYKMKMDKKFEASRADFFLGLREKETFAYKHRYGWFLSFFWNHLCFTQFSYCQVWAFETLTELGRHYAENSGSGRLLRMISWKMDKQLLSEKLKKFFNMSEALKNEVRKLKSAIEKCKSDKNTEITALLAEKKFVWHQLKKTEDVLEKEIKRKDEEVKYANEKLRQIVNTAEELQLSHENLRTTFARLEVESVRRITQRKQNACKSAEGKFPRKQFVTKGSNSSSRSSSKRKAVGVITIQDSPKLFRSDFKVPKLKPSKSPKNV
ncbi:cytomatrix family protein [Striga asiatica]|uniref:Cytomatrix family protein n=1 Tax=Striga asiatica TaxID=4170 RepID=A0A5A7RIM2_STRAF|nr:cytomatrix family protein [Striga asiatica]